LDASERLQALNSWTEARFRRLLLGHVEFLGSGIKSSAFARAPGGKTITYGRFKLHRDAEDEIDAALSDLRQAIINAKIIEDGTEVRAVKSELAALNDSTFRDFLSKVAR
jgi:hypothetical protein